MQFGDCLIAVQMSTSEVDPVACIEGRETGSCEGFDRIRRRCEPSRHHWLDPVACRSTIWAHRRCAATARQWYRCESHAARLSYSVALGNKERLPGGCGVVSRTRNKCTSTKCILQDSFSRSIKIRISEDRTVFVRVGVDASGAQSFRT